MNGRVFVFRFLVSFFVRPLDVPTTSSRTGLAHLDRVSVMVTSVCIELFFILFIY